MSWRNQIAGKRFTVVGFGASGRSVAALLADKGGQVTLNDRRSREELAADDVAALEARGVTLSLGGHAKDAFEGADAIVVSPGVPPLQVVLAAEKRGTPVFAEVEVASWFIDAPIIAVTGTNGKSTVVSLLRSIAEVSGRPHFLGGNIGTPLSALVGPDRSESDEQAASKEGLVIAELSSFQLERVVSFRAHIAVLLNCTEDHFERYDSFEDYADAKARIFLGQTNEDHAILPAEDTLVGSLFHRYRKGTRHYFGAGGECSIEGEGADAALVLHGGEGDVRVAVDALKIRGQHNALNACAAALAARHAGLPDSAIVQGLCAFPGLPHRMQLVGALDGVRYYDDSKATNVGATIAALRSLGDTPVVLIAGGRDKHGDLTPLSHALTDARGVVLMGEAAQRFENALQGAAPIARAVDMADATQKARALAQEGDAVLLAPACSSFDMYRSFAQRGDDFAAKCLEMGAA